MKQLRRMRMAVGGPLVMLTVSIGSYMAVSQRSAIADEPRADAAQATGIPTPTGKMITPAVAKGAIFQELDPGLKSAPDRRAGYAVALAASPDGKRLAILTSGFPAYFKSDGNLLPEASMEYVFLFDITENKPKETQVLSVRNTFQGIAWSPASNRIFVSGGKDDNIVEFVDDGTRFGAGRTIPLGHKTCLGAKADPYCGPVTGGLAVSPDGSRLLVANIQNDSVSLIDVGSGAVIAEQDLRPGVIDPKRHGEPGGSFPRAVTWISANRAYVASARDRQIISLEVSQNRVRVVRRMHVQGRPAALLANKGGTRLYAALDTTGRVAAFDTSRDALIETIDAVAPAEVYANNEMLGGANSNALALMPDGRTLLVSNGGQNSLAVV
jgi:DNA-binding beta-propeller fold protein YncE